MLELQETLKNFQNFILHSDWDIEAQIVGTQALPAKNRLSIYQTAYYLRLLEILKCDFHILEKYMGVEWFDQLGRDYIKAHPSGSYSIIEFGQYFCDFLKRQSITDERIQPIHLELAKFESVLENVRTARIESDFSIDQLNTLTPENWEGIQFGLNPSAQLFEASWGAPEVWQAMINNLDLPAQEKNKLETWLVWGKEGEIFFCVLDLESQCFFKAIQSGKSFGEVCIALCEVMPEEKVGEFAGQCLNQWIMDRVLVNFNISE